MPLSPIQVDSLKSKHSLEEVRDTMQPQLQRLMYILQVRRRAEGHDHLFLDKQSRN
jgi:hypothetical protein